MAGKLHRLVVRIVNSKIDIDKPKLPVEVGDYIGWRFEKSSIAAVRIDFPASLLFPLSGAHWGTTPQTCDLLPPLLPALIPEGTKGDYEYSIVATPADCAEALTAKGIIAVRTRA